MIDMVKRDVDARLQAMISAERYRAAELKRLRANPVCRVSLLPKRRPQSFEQVTIMVDGRERVLTIIDGKIFSR